MFQLQLYFAPLWRMGPRCSSAETQVCHRSYIIAAKIYYMTITLYILATCISHQLCVYKVHCKMSRRQLGKNSSGNSIVFHYWRIPLFIWWGFSLGRNMSEIWGATRRFYHFHSLRNCWMIFFHDLFNMKYVNETHFIWSEIFLFYKWFVFIWMYKE